MLLLCARRLYCVQGAVQGAFMRAGRFYCVQGCVRLRTPSATVSVVQAHAALASAADAAPATALDVPAADPPSPSHVPGRRRMMRMFHLASPRRPVATAGADAADVVVASGAAGRSSGRSEAVRSSSSSGASGVDGEPVPVVASAPFLF